MSRQLEYYYRNKAKINAKRKTRKTKKDVKHEVGSSYTPTKPISDIASMLRLHRFERKVPIAKLSNTLLERVDELRKHQMNNNEQELGLWNDVNYTITTKCVILRSIELWAYRHVNIHESLMPTANAYSDGILRAIAQKHGIELDFNQASTSIYEIEMTEHEVATRIKERGILPLHYDINGKPDIWIDKSFGLGGMESSKAEYMTRITSFTNDIADHNAWEVLKEAVPKLAETVMEIKEELKIHQSAYKALEKMAKKIDKQLNQRRLF